MNYVIITDTHFGHDELEKDCRFPGVSEKMVKSIGSSVPKDGVLVHTGDFCFGDDHSWHSKFMDRASGYKRRILVVGNHDKKSEHWYLSHGWDFVCTSFTIERFGKIITFSHIPIVDSGYDINIHGHFHDFRKEKIMEKEPKIYSILSNKHYLVSLEKLQYKPVRLEAIIEDFDKGNSTLKVYGLVED